MPRGYCPLTENEFRVLINEVLFILTATHYSKHPLLLNGKIAQGREIVQCPKIGCHRPLVFLSKRISGVY